MEKQNNSNRFVYRGAKSIRLGKFLFDALPGLKFSSFKRMLSDGRITVDSKRVKKDVLIPPGAEVGIYSDAGVPSFSVRTVYEDDNILIAVKPRGTETKNFSALASETKGVSLTPVHRMDTNTGGLLMLAKSAEALAAATEIFRFGLIEKYYYALLAGKVEKEGVFNAFLKKDAEKGIVDISPTSKKGYAPIKTGIRPFEYRDDGALTLCEIRLYTGKTHQIRAHTAFLGHPVLGDTKYGDFTLNRAARAKRQYLTSCRLVFGKIPKSNMLSYLSGKKFEISPDF